jgi:4-hydroxy-2-oxoglutarate aldolase
MNKALSGITVALTTPFVDGRISTEKISENVRRLNDVPLAGYLVLGSTGEAVYLTDSESLELVGAVVRAAAPGRHVFVGTARESTEATIDFTNRVAPFGVAAALVRPPSYYKSRITQDILREHYLALAQRSELPILLYNIPQNTGVALDTGLVVELARHPNIIGLKESSGSLIYLGEVIPRAPKDFLYFLGSGHVIHPGLEMGADGAILAVANAAPEICASIYSLFLEGRRDESRKLQLDLIPLNKAVMQNYGIPGLKWALDIRGFYGGPPRSPLLPLDEKGKREIAAVLQGLGLKAD